MYRILILNIFLQFFLFSLQGQETKVVEDLEWWGGVQYRGKLADNKLMVYGEGELRIRENMSEFKSVYGEGGLYYKISKGIKAGGAIRFTHHITWGDNLEQLIRYNIDLGFKQKIRRGSLIYRPRYQKTFANLNPSENEFVAVNVLRNKLSFSYNIKNSKFTPVVSGELFSQMKTGEISSFNLRTTIGTNYSFTKKTRIKLFYRVDYELNEIHPSTIHIIGTRIIFSKT